MIIEIVSGIIFIASTSVLWYLLSQKLPELIAIPDYIIIEHTNEESTKFHFFLLHFKSFFREKRYKIFLVLFAGKLLHRLHIVIMRFDNSIVVLLRRIRMQQVNDKEDRETIITPFSGMPREDAVATAVSSPGDLFLKKTRVMVEVRDDRSAHKPLRMISLKNSKVSLRPTVKQEELLDNSSVEPFQKRRIHRSKIVPPQM